MEIRTLNTLRALAAFIVLITHFSDATDWLDGSLGGRAGQYGVMLFFMLSGFLISHLYLDKRFSQNNLKHYLVARIARVLPLYFIVVFASYMSQQTGSDVLFSIDDGHILLGHVLFIYGESVLWSIAPEIHFYLLFIVIWYLTAWRTGYLYLIVASALILLFFANFPRPVGEWFGVHYDFHIFRSLPYFLVGLILGKHYKSARTPEYLKSHWFLLALLLIPVMYPEFSPITSDARRRMWLSYEVLFVFTAMFYSTVYLVPDNNIILANRIGDFMGKISYSLYLLHMPILWQVNKLELTNEIKLGIFITLSVLCAYLSYTVIERPLASMIRRTVSNTRDRLDETPCSTACH